MDITWPQTHVTRRIFRTGITMVLNIPPKTSNVLEIFPPWLPKGGLACFQRVNDEAILVGGPKMPLYVYSKCAGLDSC